MKMYSASKKEYSQLILDSVGIPKSYGIEPGKYEVDIIGEGQYKVVPLQPVKPKTILKIEELINLLCNAAHGYTDCEIPLNKYSKLMACFSDPVSGEKMEDFRFPPRLILKF
jgi:hypothetical protein